MFVCLCLASQKPSTREFSVPARTDFGVKLLINFSIFVRSQHLIARNVAALFSSNRGISHLNEACHIDEVIRGSILGPEILIEFGFGLL